MQIMEATRMCRGTHAASWVLLFLLATVAPGQAAGRAGALVDAVKQGDLEAVRVLLAEQVDVNAPEVDGTTALHWAANLGMWKRSRCSFRPAPTCGLRTVTASHRFRSPARAATCRRQ